MVEGTGSSWPSAMAPHRLAEDLARSRFRQWVHDGHLPEGCRGADVSTRRGDQLALQRVVIDVDSIFEHHEPARQLTLQPVGHADHRALGHRRVRRQHRLHQPRGEPVPGDVDHVVGTSHHEQVAVIIEVSAVTGEVVAREPRQVGRDIPVRRCPTGWARCPAASAASGRPRLPDRAPSRCRPRPESARRTRAPAPTANRPDRHRFQPAQARRDRPSGLGLPPVVDHRYTQLGLRPPVGLRVQPLTGQEQ